MRRVVIVIHTVSAVVFTGLTLALWSDSEFCFAAMMMADVNLLAALMLNFAVSFAAEQGTYDNAKLKKIADTAAAEMLLLTVPLLLSPLLCSFISKTALAVYINISGLILFVSVLVIDRKSGK